MTASVQERIFDVRGTRVAVTGAARTGAAYLVDGGTLVMAGS